MEINVCTYLETYTNVFLYFQIGLGEKKSVPCSLELENPNFESITPLEEDESPDLDEFRLSF